MLHTTKTGGRARLVSNLPANRGQSTIERIGAQIEPQHDGCWLWRGNPDTYGKPNQHGSSVLVHRYVYRILVGPIPDGHDLHHTCETPGCCNPAHLVPLTHSEHRALHHQLAKHD
jgi:HNH endonuclease